MTHPLVGRRVRLRRCTDPHTRLAVGQEGVIAFVDSLGTVHVDWDDGHKLGLVTEAGDRYDLLPSESGHAAIYYLLVVTAVTLVAALEGILR